jgi:hypothetical protein
MFNSADFQGMCGTLIALTVVAIACIFGAGVLVGYMVFGC